MPKSHVRSRRRSRVRGRGVRAKALKDIREKGQAASKGQALVRRNLLSNDMYASGIESGTEVFQGTGRLDTKAYSVNIG